MTVPSHLSQTQFGKPQGDPAAKDELYKQLRGNFKKRDLEWLKDERVTVDAPARVPSDKINWEHYPTWRASRQLKAVRKIAKKIDKGKDKPSTFVDYPGNEGLFIMDGHHHALGYHDHKDDPLGYVIHVPSSQGPWRTLHDRQVGDDKKDDFGKTNRNDREH